MTGTNAARGNLDLSPRLSVSVFISTDVGDDSVIGPDGVCSGEEGGGNPSASPAGCLTSPSLEPEASFTLGFFFCCVLEIIFRSDLFAFLFGAVGSSLAGRGEGASLPLSEFEELDEQGASSTCRIGES
ncbi:hypothetical protein ZWY2020_051873 [Hordeum vulgare]|nr:hypothetical protein ZWY2020_051873 [Hordeum vulgare]